MPLILLVIFLFGFSPVFAYSEKFFPVDRKHFKIRLDAHALKVSRPLIRVSFRLSATDEPVQMQIRLSPGYIDHNRDWKEDVATYLREILPSTLNLLHRYSVEEMESIPLLSRLSCKIYIGPTLYGGWSQGQLIFRNGIY